MAAQVGGVAALDFLDTIRDWLDMLDPQVRGYVVQVLRLCIWLVILSVVFTPLERLFALRPKKLFRKAILTDIGYYFLNSLVPGFLLGFPVAAIAWSVHHFVPAGYLAFVAHMPLWARLTGAMVVGEIGSYWGHRWSHEIPLLWRFHSIHHSAEEMDFLVSSRAHPVDLVFTRICELTPMYVLGLTATGGLQGTWIPIVVILIGQFWGFFIHANLNWRFGPLEWFISTPPFHHWHHTNDGPEYINKNYAPMLPWVDKLFGTFFNPKERPERYGIEQPISPVLFDQLVHPFLFWRKGAANPAPPPMVNSEELTSAEIDA
ncbi:MAG TPA: sterol desaturase family protein [Acidobacteriaceae bacterium]|nr:sterol desaturase family protein [Acidobacteriaceae bacterium]